MVNPQTSIRTGEAVSGYRLSSLIRCLLSVLALCVANPSTAQVPDLTNGEARTSDKFWNLGPTGMTGWFFHEAGATTENARQIEVATVDAGSPADGILAVDDVILGADGTGADPVAFTSDARKAFAHAIADAEASSPATLKLLRWRADVTDIVSITLETLGAYSATAPYNCPKSAAILEKGLDAVMAGGADDNYNLSLLALLAGNDPANPKNAARMARAQQKAHELILTPEQIAEYTSPIPLTYSKVAWTLGFKLVAIAEYYLQTGDSAVYDSMRAYAIAYANGQSMFGTGGHQFSKLGADGSINGPYGIGYGVVNSANMQCFYGVLLAREAGVNDQEVLDAIERASRFYGAYVDRGSIPYGEHGPGGGHESNGKCGIAALCFKLEGTREYEANYYAKMAGGSANNRDGGHTGPYLNYLWAPLGANAGGEESMAAFFAEQSWHYDLSRNWDGSFTYNTYGQGNNGGPNWSSSNLQMYLTTLLSYATPLRQTYATGKNQDPLNPLLSPAEVDEVQFSAGYTEIVPGRTTNELMQDITSWSPNTRAWASGEIANRSAEHATLLPALTSMATDTNAPLHSRLGAVTTIGKISDASSVPVLVNLLSDAEDRVRWAASEQLAYSFSDETKELYIDTLLEACVSTAKPALPLDEEDPIHLTHGNVVFSLFGLGGTTPRGLFYNHDLVGIDRDLLYPAIRSVAGNPRGIVRGCLQSVYSKLSREDIEAVADAVVENAMFEAPADRMFSEGARTSSLNLLQVHNFSEGVPLAKKVAKELGSNNRTPALQYLEYYSGSSLSVTPDPGIIEFCQVLIANDENVAAAQAVINAITADTSPEEPTPFKGINSVIPEKAFLTLPEDWTVLRTYAYDHALGDPVYAWRKVHGAGEVRFTPNGTAAAKGTTVVFDGTPGQYLFEVTMSDSRGLTEVTETLAYTLYDTGGTLPANSAPTADPQSLTIEQGTPSSIILSGTDPEAYPLTYAVTGGPNHGVLSGTAPNLIYTPAADYTGSDSITFEVMDSEGQVSTAVLNITVNTASPVGLAIYEPFDYPAGDLNGVSGSNEIGLNGVWTTGIQIYTESYSIGYGTLPTNGLRLWSVGVNSPGGARPISPGSLAGRGLLDDGATLWFSFIHDPDDSVYPKDTYFALANDSFSYSPKVDDDGAQLGSGVGVSILRREVRATQFRDTANDPIQGEWDQDVAGQVNPDMPRLIVGKMTWGASEDMIEIYLPFEDMILPSEPTSTLIADVDQSSFDTVTFARGNNVAFDEIRFGATLQSVLQGTVDMTPDVTAPAPDPMTFEIAPASGSPTSITMTATPAYDPMGVEYYFTCTEGGGNDSGWQESRVYTDADLTPGVAYSYTVKARDKYPALNETAMSPAASATIPSLGTIPNVVGMLQATAESLIADAGMAVGTVTQSSSYSLTVPAGNVISQSPSGNASTAYSTAVNLEISIGQDPALPTLASVDIVDDQGGGPVTLPAVITYTLTFSQGMDLSTIDTGDFINLEDIPIIIGAINQTSPGVVTVEVTPDGIDSGYLLFAIAQGAVIRDAQGNDLNTNSAIADDDSISILLPDNWAPLVDAGVDQAVNIDSAQPWSPSAISTVAWFDASDATTITENAGAVSQWADKSGNGNHAGQGNASNQPTYNNSDTRLNHLPTIGYDQGFKYLQTSTIAAIQNVYVVTYYDDADHTFDSHRVLFSDTGNSIKMQGSSGNNDWVSGKGFDQHRDGSTTSSDLDILPMGPTLWTAKGTATHSSMAWRILGGTQNYQYWEYGAVGEVILTDGSEDLATQQQIEGYLAHKWGLTANLPADHPYKSNAPTVLSAVATLDASVVDYDNDSINLLWRMVSGPGGVNFADATAVDTTASFTVAGTYLLELTADDGIDQASDQLMITVQQGNDTTPPTLSGSDIVDDQGGADVTENTPVVYTLTFSEDMNAVTVDANDFGNAGTAPISIGAITEVSPGVFQVVVTPTSTGTLQLKVLSGADLRDTAGNALETTTDIIDDTSITVTSAPDTVAPEVITFSPAHTATEVNPATDLVITFNEDVAFGSGNITLRQSSGALVESFDVATPPTGLTLTDDTVTINPSSDLALSTTYYVEIDATAIDNLAGDSFAGISGSGTWSFTISTVDAALLVYEPFDYSGTFNGTQGGALGTTGNWTQSGGAGLFAVSSGLSFTGLSTTGGSAKRNTAPGGSEMSIGISGAAQTALTADDTTIYFSVLVRNDRYSAGNENLTFAIGTAAFDDSGSGSGVEPTITGGEAFGLHLDAATNGGNTTIDFYGYSVDGGTATQSTGYQDNDDTVQTFMVVGRIDWAANGSNDTLTLYNVADPSAGLPGSSFATMTADLDQSAFDTLALASQQIATIDEIRFGATLANVGVTAGGGGTGFSDWIAGFDVSEQTGFDQDPDGDGIDSGVEAFFGTAPNAHNAGLSSVSSSGNSLTFTHPEADPQLTDVTGSYEWSLDLSNWNASGDDVGGTIVTIGAVQDTPESGTTTVTASVAGIAPSKVFVRVVATQN